MLHAIEEEFVIPPDGKLPEAFRQYFGRKAKVIILLPDEAESLTDEASNTSQLMELAEGIEAFKAIEDPIAWQRALRDEWDRGWDK